ncbi:MAG: hypothetical protein H6620_10690 [Halobacteriovoraceae bacterium]|nr:hypothetical protein [Halobacteriovoraceae bacterium]
MIYYTRDKDIYEREMKRAGQVFLDQTEIPEMVFDKKFSYFLGLEFTELWEESFFLLLNSLLVIDKGSYCNLLRGSLFYKNYFKQTLKLYPLIQIAKSSSYNDYLNILSLDITSKGELNNITLTEDIIKIFPENNTWGAYFHRESEIGIIAFKDEIHRDAIRDSKQAATMNIKSIVELVTNNMNLPRAVLEQYHKIITNYRENLL